MEQQALGGGGLGGVLDVGSVGVVRLELLPEWSVGASLGMQGFVGLSGPEQWSAPRGMVLGSLVGVGVDAVPGLGRVDAFNSATVC